MYCPKCRNPLYNENKCNICGWTKVVEPAPEPEAPTEVKQERQFPKSYYIDSYILFAFVLIIGLLRVYIYYKSGSPYLYKGIINCLAALVFLPQIKVDTNSTVLIFFVKVCVALLVILFI